MEEIEVCQHDVTDRGLQLIICGQEMKIAAEKKRKDEAAKRLIESHKFAEEHPLQREISPVSKALYQCFTSKA